MAAEIERRFALKSNDLSFLDDIVGTPIIQGYLHEDGMTSRIRIAGDIGYLTLKRKVSALAKAKSKPKNRKRGFARKEFEYSIPLADAKDLLLNHTVGRLVTKTRFRIPYAGNIWEVDVFSGFLKGLVIAEIELEGEKQKFRKPDWVGAELTGIKELSNKNLSRAKKAPLLTTLLAA